MLIAHSSNNHDELGEFYAEMELPYECRDGKVAFGAKLVSSLLGRLGDLYRYLLKTSHQECDDYWTCALTSYRFAIKIDPMNGIIFNHMVILY